MINSENVKIFAGTSNKDLAKKIAEKYGLPLGKADVVRFKDGEVFVKIDETVRGSSTINFWTCKWKLNGIVNFRRCVKKSIS